MEVLFQIRNARPLAVDDWVCDIVYVRYVRRCVVPKLSALVYRIV